jgi:superfamily II DNA or RNA helicase
LEAVRVKTSTNLDDVHTVGGEFNQRELADEINTLSRNQLIVDSWKKYCEGRQTLAFCVDIKHAVDLAEQFKMNGINAIAVSSNEELTPNRSENIIKYKEGQTDILTNVGILVAGFDHPDTGAIIMACPTKSLTKYLQAVGRCARLKSDEYVAKFKQQAIILDIIDNTTRHNLINTWELDRKKDIDDRVFITSETRDKIKAARELKKTMGGVERKEDERIKLLTVLSKKISFSSRMIEQATEAQLKFIAGLGYDIEGTVYTKRMISEILDELPAKKEDLAMLKAKGFDISGVITRGQASYTLWVENNKNR